MTTISAQRGRPPHKSAAILKELRQRILSGQIAPGARLPGRFELSETFDASTATVQHAINDLLRDGFIDVLDGVGTFVADHPPHLCRYAIAFPHSTLTWSRFYEAIRVAAEIITRDDPHRRFNLYYDIAGHTDVEDYKKLVADLRARRLAGLIFASPLLLPKDSPLRADDGLPRMAIAVANHSGIARLPVRFPDMAGCRERALRLAAAMPGPRRLAVISASSPEHWLELLSRSAVPLGLQFERRHLQCPWHDSATAIRLCVQGLLGESSPDRRPNILIIDDDNYVEEATKGIVETGLRVPQDMTVIAHCNWPAPPPAAVPVTRLGFDARVLLAECIHVIDSQREGVVPPPARLLPVQLQEEQATDQPARAVPSL